MGGVRGRCDVIGRMRKYGRARRFMAASGAFISPRLFDFETSDGNCSVEIRSAARGGERPVPSWRSAALSWS